MLSFDTNRHVAPDQPQRLPFTFTGDASSYFGVWIVNVLLSIVTLGIYSAWAKVRRLRYFYGHTFLDGHNFEYHANPSSILIGRLIVVGMIAAFQLLTALHPAFGLLGLIYVPLLPLLINKSIAFNARMTSHRSIRFGFAGDYGEAFVVYVLWPVAAIFTLGLLLPLGTRARWRYLASNLTYGDAPFSGDPKLGALYANFGASVLVGLGSIAALSGVAFALSGGAFSVWHFLVVFFYGGFAAAVVFHSAGARNIGLSSVTLQGGHALSSHLHRGRYLWIMASNLAVTLCTIGLMRPWAAIRVWRYSVDHTEFLAGSSLDAFTGRVGQAGNVVASEFADLESLDVGI